LDKAMNEAHMELLTSDEWAEHVTDELIPEALSGVQLGSHLLEVGPGPGKTTDVLRHAVEHLTAVEVDPALAAELADRLAGTNVEVVEADGTALPFADGSFTSASSFTMLHHVPTPELQDLLLTEVARVLEPGGVFVGADSYDSDEMRELHVDDVLVPVDPATFPDRLHQAGFGDVEITRLETSFCFRARRRS
jgi:ubiquinone/menaquinone biosynthesis C-methylase UbiE